MTDTKEEVKTEWVCPLWMEKYAKLIGNHMETWQIEKCYNFPITNTDHRIKGKVEILLQLRDKRLI